VTVINSSIVLVVLLTFALYSSIQHLLPVCFNKFSVQCSDDTLRFADVGIEPGTRSVIKLAVGVHDDTHVDESVRLTLFPLAIRRRVAVHPVAAGVSINRHGRLFKCYPVTVAANRAAAQHNAQLSAFVSTKPCVQL